ncbi:MAG: cyclic pyranopterin monophosphate synthase MoaC [Eubacteriales bacterium]|nr:cyclic pyranopterin monophosphate synthase MoaC [Eubacteriales bacterium]
MAKEFTHFNDSGDAIMVNVSDKALTKRVAVAEGQITLSPEAYAAVMNRTVQKGDVLGVARLAGIMGAKRTAELIPLCHPLGLTGVEVDFLTDDAAHTVTARATASIVGKTGVEMEALTAVQIALLTIYDMCKAVDKRMVMNRIHLVEKTGGKSGTFRFDESN